ncbi:MAG: hypothetical protein AAF805_10595 [Planctomycetota bacterium]
MTDWMEDTDAAWLAPPGGDAAGAVVVLADVGEPAGADRFAWGDALFAHGIAVVAPRHADPWWTDRSGSSNPANAATAEAIVLRTAEMAVTRYGRVAIAGAGAGGHGALRIAYKHPRRFPVVAAGRPAIDCHALLDRWRPPAIEVPVEAVAALRDRYGGDAERARQDSATLHIHPLNWPRNQRFDCPPADAWWEGCDRLRMKLSSLGVPHDADLENDQTAESALTQTAAWIADRLAAEARRVP